MDGKRRTRTSQKKKKKKKKKKNHSAAHFCFRIRRFFACVFTPSRFRAYGGIGRRIAMRRSLRSLAAAARCLGDLAFCVVFSRAHSYHCSPSSRA